MKYELIDHCDLRNEYYFHALVKCITGLEYDESDKAIKANKNNGQGIIQIFRDLGFNVSPRWKKFDPETEYPVMIRCKARNHKKYWYPFVYYDGKVYAPHHGGTYPTLDDFLKQDHGLFRITSMIQIWV